MDPVTYLAEASIFTLIILNVLIFGSSYLVAKHIQENHHLKKINKWIAFFVIIAAWPFGLLLGLVKPEEKDEKDNIKKE